MEPGNRQERKERLPSVSRKRSNRRGFFLSEGQVSLAGHCQHPLGSRQGVQQGRDPCPRAAVGWGRFTQGTVSQGVTNLCQIARKQSEAAGGACFSASAGLNLLHHHHTKATERPSKPATTLQVLKRELQAWCTKSEPHSSSFPGVLGQKESTSLCRASRAGTETPKPMPAQAREASPSNPSVCLSPRLSF